MSTLNRIILYCKSLCSGLKVFSRPLGYLSLCASVRGNFANCSSTSNKSPIASGHGPQGPPTDALDWDGDLRIPSPG